MVEIAGKLQNKLRVEKLKEKQKDLSSENDL